MIIDTVSLAGRAAYLRDGDSINLATSAHNAGSTAALTAGVEGIAVDVAGVRLLLEGDDLPALWARADDPDGDRPLLSFAVHKEIFPDFFADPYTHRVHALAGLEDLARGVADGLRTVEVNGVPTLVSVGVGEVSWTSALYRMPHPVPLEAASWGLAVSRLAPPGAFTYRLELHHWTVGQDIATDAPTVIALTPAAGATPDKPRHRRDLGLTAVIGYVIVFTATVDHDVAMSAFIDGAPGRENIGGPLLQTVNLLESITSIHEYHTLLELADRAREFRLFETSESQLYATVDFAAVLLPDEHISLVVHRPERFSRVEARLDAEVRTRPPRTAHQA